jgi:hypothetical protein
MMGAPMAMVGLGANILGGVLGAAGAKQQAAGAQLGIKGQMLATVGQAYQFDVQAGQFTLKSKEDDYKAEVAKLNRDIAKQNASYELSKGEKEAEISGMAERYALGEMKAAQAASGIAINSGSAGRVRESMVEVGQTNTQIMRANAAHIAYGYDVQAMQFEGEAAIHSMESEINKFNAESAKTAAGITRQALPLQSQAYEQAGTMGNINALASITGAAGSVASKWTQGQFQGLFKTG